ncbi:hypothetical protein F2P81_020281 [Scophthalmus maximus]|uniref:Uncharacterized protein n=1 Tax=Scophthalmus maximus TaxID=52904 RepID=A0A6A4S7K3_SCOMX|nr:hypothetical protein F2P81_020281 [Scophthalmus maximus]
MYCIGCFRRLVICHLKWTPHYVSGRNQTLRQDFSLPTVLLISIFCQHTVDYGSIVTCLRAFFCKNVFIPSLTKGNQVTGGHCMEIFQSSANESARKYGDFTIDVSALHQHQRAGAKYERLRFDLAPRQHDLNPTVSPRISHCDSTQAGNSDFCLARSTTVDTHRNGRLDAINGHSQKTVPWQHSVWMLSSE